MLLYCGKCTCIEINVSQNNILDIKHTTLIGRSVDLHVNEV